MERQGTIGRFLRFGIVGGMGTVTNLIVYSGVLYFTIFDHNISAILSFFVAAGQNYILNRLWTFSDHQLQGRYVSSALRYLIVNGIGLGINLFTLNLLVLVFLHIAGSAFPVIAQAGGILVAMAFNYLLTKSFVFHL